MFPGTELEVNGKKHIVPPLSIKQLREGGLDIMKQTDECAKASESGYETMELRGKLIHMAMQRNYPDISLDDVLASLDLANTVPLWLAVLGTSGLGVNAKTGEAQAGSLQEPTGGITQLTPGTSGPSTVN